MNSRSLAVRKRMLEVRISSIRALADKAGLSQSVVNQWLSYKTVTDETFEKIAAALDLTPKDLRQLLETGGLIAAG